MKIVMARKSRKNMMPQAAVQEAVQQNEKELLRTAAYARLSVENGGHETEDSLHTQILQIHNYIRENPELTLTDTYADNGFTGTRFDRPEFERMMQDIRTGKIQCIVVKDLSRFGRDYIETGSYMISGLQNQIPKPYSMAFISLTIRVRISCSISLQSKRRR